MLKIGVVRRKEDMVSGCRVVLASAILSLALVESAWAYLDPGTGFMILQGLVAALAAAGVAVGTCWSKVRGWFSPRPKQGAEDQILPRQEQK